MIILCVETLINLNCRLYRVKYLSFSLKSPQKNLMLTFAHVDKRGEKNKWTEGLVKFTLFSVKKEKFCFLNTLSFPLVTL